MVGFMRTTSAAALLFLSSGLFNFALGSFASRADAVSVVTSLVGVADIIWMTMMTD